METKKDTNKPDLNLEIVYLKEKITFLENQISGIQQHIYHIHTNKDFINAKFTNCDYDLLSTKISFLQKDLEKIQLKLLKKIDTLYKFGGVVFIITSILFTLIHFLSR